MTDQPPNPPAFPHPSGAQGCDGMTLRDWFAGQALAGLMANPSLGDDRAPHYAFFLADAMLIERNRK